jgi:ABC-2 type transport system permease protein
MNPARVWSIGLRQFYLMRGSFARVVPLFLWVAIDMILWGFMTRYLGTISQLGTDLVPTLLGAVLLWDFLIRVMQGVSTTFLEDIWSRNLLNIFASPITTSEYVSGLVLTSILTSLVGLLVMLVLATFIFGLSYLKIGLLLVPLLLGLFCFGIALGVMACAMVLRLGPSAEWFVWPIPTVIAPFAGVFYPISTLPSWMQVVATALPPAHLFDAMRITLSGAPAPLTTVLLGLGLAVFDLALAMGLFRSVFRRAVRTGLLARYSAESTG